MKHILEKAQNTKQQGDMGVAAAIAFYTIKGYNVLSPLTDNARYDLVVEKDGIFTRIQCKTTQSRTKFGIFQVGVRTHGGNQSWNKSSLFLSKEEIDLLFVVTDEGKIYEFPPEFFDKKGSVNLGKDKEIYSRGYIFN